MKDEILKKITGLKSLYVGPELNNDKKDRLTIFRETGKIILYPTELSYEVNRKDFFLPKGKCNRQVFFNFFDFIKTDPQSINLLETYDLGKSVEWMIKKELRLIELASEENFEVEFRQEFEGSDVIISGKKDVVLNDGTIIEIKSTKDSEAGLKMLAEAPYAVHLPQLAMYLAERKLNGVENPKLLVWYKGKINLTNVIKELTLNDDGFLFYDGKPIKDYNFVNTISRMKDLEAAIKEGVIPKRDFPIITPSNAEALWNLGLITLPMKNKVQKENQECLMWECSECEYRTLCKAKDDETN